MNESETSMSHSPWPARPLFLASLLGISAYCIYHLLESGESNFALLAHWRISSAGGLGIFAIGFGLCAVRQKVLLTATFALALGLLVTGISYWRLQIQWPYIWNFWSLGLALLIILPFFQAALASDWNNYRELHKQAWGNAVVLLLSFMFTAISFGMAHLLAELFQLIGIDLLQKLLNEDSVNWILAGVALGGAMGVLREHDNIIDATQRLAQSVLSLLALPLSFALVVFLATLPFTGLQPLWEATRNTSPIVFVCALGSILLLNAVIRDTDSDINAGFAVQLSARALAIVVAPLAAIAVVSITTRVQQYGWTPDRLWASLICTLLLIYGLLYLSVLQPNADWRQRIRRINLLLALLTSGIALLLSTPLLDFGAISARNQIQRLHSGEANIRNFDAVAMANDFGPAGRAALEALDTSKDKQLARKVKKAISKASARQANNRQSNKQDFNAKLQQLTESLIVQPANSVLDDALVRLLAVQDLCAEGYCQIFMNDAISAGTVLNYSCEGTIRCVVNIMHYQQCENGWQNTTHRVCNIEQSKINANRKAKMERLEAAMSRGEVEIRDVVRRQAFVGGEPVGETFK